MCNLPDLTYGLYDRFKCGMHEQQERIDSLKYCNGTVVLTPVSLSFLQPNMSFYLSKRLLFRPNYITLLVTVNQMSRLGDAPHGSCVYRGKSRVYDVIRESFKRQLERCGLNPSHRTFIF